MLEHDEDDINPDANGAIVVNMGGPHPEDGLAEQGGFLSSCWPAFPCLAKTVSACVCL